MLRILCTVLVLMSAALPAGAFDILLIDDGFDEGLRNAKSPEHRGGEISPRSSISELESDLIALGHSVTIVPSDISEPWTWTFADVVLWSSGNHPLPLGNPAWRASLRHYVTDGGKLLIEGGDIAYHWIPGDPLFASAVLHGGSWLGDPESALTLVESEHPLATVPNALPALLGLTVETYTDTDAVTPANDALVPYFWIPGPPTAGYLAYDADPAPTGGQIIYLPFRYSAVDPLERIQLLENAVTWLGTEDLGDASFSGQVHLVGEDDHRAAKVQVQPGGHWTETDSEGHFLIDGLFGGTRYSITVSKEGFRSAFSNYELDDGEHVDDLYFSLNPVIQFSDCSSPELPIPDDDPFGVSDTIMVSGGGFVEQVEVFLDIHHTWIGDLVAYLKSPAGTTCLLHFRSGSNLNEIYGWYPLEIGPVQNLGLFADEFADGPWVMHVADFASADTGQLNEWCLRLTVHDGTDVPLEAGQAAARLLPNWPNPFNPKTFLHFRLDRGSRVKLEVLDPRGRRVREIWANPLGPGDHLMEWDGRDDLGRPMPSGLYLLRLKADEQVQTRKLMLLK